MKASTSSSIVVFAFALALNVDGSTRYVDLNCTNPVPPYTSWATAATNIQQAINVGGAGVVLVTNGVYSSGNSSGARVNVPGGVVLQSANGPAVTLIEGYQVPGTTNGSAAIRCVYLNPGASISGFTLTNGATAISDFGGGVKCAAANCIVSNCVLAGNSAYVGGGGALNGTLIDCTLFGNTVTVGGGSGGGGANGSALTNCLLTRNFSAYAGGAAVQCSLANCTVVSNAAATYAGAAWNCTFYNSIVYYNNSYYTNADNSGNYGTWTSCCTPFTSLTGANNFTNPPLFANFAGSDYHLNAASPCINAGNNAFNTSATDLDGNARIVAGTIDVGAYEFQPAIHYVRLNNPAPVSPYSNWAGAATNIQDAIDVSGAGDFVIVTNGTYNIGSRIVSGVTSNRVVIDKAVAVQSVNGPSATVIAGLPGNGAYASTGIRCVYMVDGAALIGFTVTNGATSGFGTDTTNDQSGAGVWCQSTNANISNCVLAHCYANGLGGGAFSGTLNNCTISGDTAFLSGGGAYSANLNNCIVQSNQLIQGSGGGGAAFGTLSNCLLTWNYAPGSGGGAFASTLYNCVISNNTAGNGGGVAMGFANNSIISSNSARLNGSGGGAYSNVLNNCVVQNNLTAGNGGGAFASRLTSCIVSNNSANNGGGTYIGTMTNSLVLGNTATTEGGGAWTGNSDPVYNCTIVSNTASASGGVREGICVNSIIYFNNAGSNPNGHPLIVSHTCMTPLQSGTGNITNDPLFVDPLNGNFHLQSNSPCINSGSNASVSVAVDLDGFPRIAGGTVDMGAYEFPSPSSILSYAWAQQFGLATDGSADFSDSDGDGMNNWQEWIAGTDPTNAASVLLMYSPSNSLPGIAVSWQSVSGKSYFLERASDLAAQPAFSGIQSNIAGQAGTTSYTDTTATNEGPYFYRVGVQ